MYFRWLGLAKNSPYNAISEAKKKFFDKILDKYRLIKVDMSEMVIKALEDMDLDAKSKARCTNMFALGLLYWLYERDMQTTIDFLKKKFKNNSSDMILPTVDLPEPIGPTIKIFIVNNFSAEILTSRLKITLFKF